MEVRSLIAVVLMGVLVSGVGCAQTVDIQFDAPPGSTMTLGGQTYELPEMLSLKTPTDNALWDGAMSRREQVTFRFPLEDGTLSAEGVLDLYKFNEQDVDRYARNRCPIELHHIERMREGYAVVIDGHSASNQRIFRLTMGER